MLTFPQVVDRWLSIYGFVDDHNLGCGFIPGTPGNKDELDKITSLTDSLKSINTWMNRNRLCMTNAKTEVLMIGSQSQLSNCITTSLNVNGIMVQTSKMIKYMGTYLDNSLSFKHHISTKCRVAVWNLQCLKLLWPSLTLWACITLVLGLVISHLDHVNSAFIGLWASDINKMQRVQNAAAKFVLGQKRMDSSAEALKTLHWLPIKFRNQFKIVLLVNKCLNGQTPSYLSEWLELKSTTSRPGLRSTCDRTLLCIPFTKRKTFTDRSFSIAWHKLWNCLPKTIRESPNTDSFKKHLKTHMFDLAF